MHYRHARKHIIASVSIATVIGVVAVTGGGAVVPSAPSNQSNATDTEFKTMEDRSVGDGVGSDELGRVKKKSYDGSAGQIDALTMTDPAATPVTQWQHQQYGLLQAFVGPASAAAIMERAVPGFTAKIRTNPIPAGQTYSSYLANVNAKQNLDAAAGQQRAISQTAAAALNNGDSNAGLKAAQSTSLSNMQRSQSGNSGSKNSGSTSSSSGSKPKSSVSASGGKNTSVRR